MVDLFPRTCEFAVLVRSIYIAHDPLHSRGSSKATDVHGQLGPLRHIPLSTAHELRQGRSLVAMPPGPLVKARVSRLQQIPGVRMGGEAAETWQRKAF